MAMNIISVTKVPRFAGRKPFSATPTEYAATIGHSSTSAGYAYLRMP